MEDKVLAQELADILSLKAVRKFIINLEEKFGIPVFIFDRKGKLIPEGRGRAGKSPGLIIRRIFSKLDLTPSRTRLSLSPGIRLYLYPIHAQNHVRGLMVAGPLLGHKVNVRSLKSLSSRFDLDLEKIKESFHHLPRIEPSMRKVAEGLIETLAETVSQFLAEKMNYAKHFQETFAVHKVVKSLNTTLSLEEVMSRMLQYSIEILGANRGSVMLLDREDQHLGVFVSLGYEEQSKNVRIPIGEGLEGKVTQTGIPELSLKTRRASGIRDREQSRDSCICAPLIVSEETLGVISISGARNNRDFTLSDLEVLDVIASSAAVAINNAKLYENLRRKVQEHATLFHVATTLSSSLDPARVLQDVLDKAIRLLDAKKGSLMLIDEDTQELRIVNACGLTDEIIASTRIKVGEGISGRVAKDGEPLLIRKGVKHSDSYSAREELDSAISVPVNIKEKVIGVLNIRDQVNGSNFTQEQMGLLQMMASQAAIAIENSRLHRELKELFVGSVKALVNAIEARDPYTKGHSVRVTHYAVKLGKALGMSPGEIENLQYASILHDIGKINIKDDILMKPGKLTPEERVAIQKHPSYGALIMQPVRAFQKILPVLYSHHERYDGSGYAQKLCGADIPIESRIIAIADSFDAMTSDRPYRKALTMERAIAELKSNAGTQFDPELVDVFVALTETDSTCNPDYDPEGMPFV